MLITAPSASNYARDSSVARRLSSSTFTLAAEGKGARAQDRAGPVRTSGGLDALVALQGVADATEHRRRQLARGRHALDALEKLKLGLLAGSLDTVALASLRAAALATRESSGDPGLDEVLSAIDLRVAVEIAKLAPR